MLIDTGANLCAVPIDRINQFNTTPTPAVYESGTNVRGVHQLQIHLLPRLTLGALNEPDIVVFGMPPHEMQPDTGLLGLPLLSRFRFTLDFAHKRLLLERSANYAVQSRLPGATAIRLTQRDQAIRIGSVVPQSTAARADLRVDDELIEIDDIPAKELTLPVAQHLLDGFANTLAHLVVKRGGAAHTLTFQRQSLFAFAGGSTVGIGVNMSITPEGRMVVSGVDLRSPAEEAGIRKGDEIVEVNGLDARKTPLAEIVQQLKQPKGTVVTLKLRRQDEDQLREVKLKARKLL